MPEASPHWSKVTESGTLLGMRFLLGLYCLFGRRGFRIFLFPVMAYYYSTQRRAREASQEYLQRLQETYPDLPKLSSFSHFMMFGDILLDKLLVWMGRIQTKDVDFYSDGSFETALSQQQGGIIVVSHLGNTEICNALAYREKKLKVTLLVYTEHAKKFNGLIQKLSKRTNFEMYQVTEMSPAFAMMMAERVDAGEFLVIAADRTPVTGQQRIAEVDFLGAQAAFPQGAFILASLLKCPVFLMFCLKQEQRYQLHIEHFASQLVSSRASRDVMLQKAIQDFAARLALYCRQAPLQWFNFFSFWQTPRAVELPRESQ